jgi:hypothetical protein
MNRRAVLLLLSCPFWFCAPACTQKTEHPQAHPDIVSAFEPFPGGEGKLELDRWYLIELQGQPAGWVHTQVLRHATTGGPRWDTKTEELVVVLRGTEKMEGRTKERYLENQRGQLLRLWQMEQEQDGEKVVVRAGKVGAELVTLRGPEVRRVPFDPRAFATQRSLQILFTGEAPKAGEVRKFRSHDPMAAGYADNRLVVRSTGPKATELEHTTTALPGVVATVRLDANYTATRMEFRIGALHFVQRQVDQKPDLDEDGNAADIDPLMVIPSNVRINNPRAVARARYRLEGLPEYVDSSWLTGTGQRASAHSAPGVFLLEVERLDDPPLSVFPPDVKDPGLRKYLASTQLTRLNDPDVIKIAKTVTAGAADAWTAAKRLRRWVSEEIEGGMGMGFASASQTLKRREGDCSEQAVLLTALARSVGIPARCVMGLVYQDGSFFRHMWTEVWVGRWQPLDPAQATDFISAAWIRLAVHSLQLTDDEKTGAGGLMLFGAELKVNVEKVETAKR